MYDRNDEENGWLLITVRSLIGSVLGETSKGTSWITIDKNENQARMSKECGWLRNTRYS